VARMSSFGEGIQITPLQLAALAAAFANGGTLYYLQYPHSQEEMDNFAPRVKRDLNISNVLPEVREGMLAAVLYGTGRLSYDKGGDEMPLGKTGTCDDHSNTPSRIGVRQLCGRDAPEDCPGRVAPREYAPGEGSHGSPGGRSHLPEIAPRELFRGRRQGNFHPGQFHRQIISFREIRS